MKLKSVRVSMYIIGLLLLISVIIFYREYSLYNYKSIFFKNNFGTHRRRPVTENDIAHIARWMTFDYINHLFVIPDDYLKQRLSISDSRYPFITIDKYTKATNGNAVQVLTVIKQEVKAYMDLQIKNK